MRRGLGDALAFIALWMRGYGEHTLHGMALRGAGEAFFL